MAAPGSTPPNSGLYRDQYGRQFVMGPYGTPVNPPMNPAAMAAQASASATSEPPLPPGWDMGKSADGRTYYIDHNAKHTQWVHPLQSQQASTSPAVRGSLGAIPTAVPAMAVGSPPVSSGFGGNNYASYQYLSSIPSYMSNAAVPVPVPGLVPQNSAAALNASVYVPGPALSTTPPSSLYGSMMPGMAAVPGAGRSLRLALSKQTWEQKEKDETNCSKCSMEFTMMKRRHHCRCCSREYCANDSAKSHSVRQFNHNEPVRVCDACFKHLNRDDPHCIARLVPYLKQHQEEVQALTELVDLCKRGSRYTDDVPSIGLVPLLPRLLGSGPHMKTLATALVAAIAQDDAVAEQLTELNVPRMLVDQLGGDGTAVLEALQALAFLAKKEKNQPIIADGVVLAFFVSTLGAPASHEDQLTVARALRSLTTAPVNRDRIIDAGALPPVIVMLKSANAAVAGEAAGVVEQLAMSDKSKQLLLEPSVISALVGHLSHEGPAQAPALGALMLLSTSAGVADAIIRSKGVAPLVALLKSKIDAVKAQALSLLNTLSLAKDAPNTVTPELIGGLALLLSFLQSSSPQLIDTSLALLTLMSVDSNCKMLMREADGLTLLIAVLRASNEQHKLGALSAIAAAAMDSDENCAAFAALNIHTDLATLLASPNPALVCGTLGVLSVLFQSPRQQEPPGIVQALTSLAVSDNDKVREAAARAMTSLAKRPAAKEAMLAQNLQGVLAPLISSNTPAVARAGLGLLHAFCAQDVAASAAVCEVVARPVMNALNGSGEGVALAAATALCDLCKSARAMELLLSLGVATAVRQRLSSNDAALQAREVAAAELMAVFATDRRAVAALRESQAVASLAECLFSSNKFTSSNALTALSRLLAVPDSAAAVGSELQAAGGVLALTNMLAVGQQQQSQAVQEMAVASLAQLAIASSPCREQLVTDSTASALLAVLSQRTCAQPALQILCLLFTDARVTQRIKGDEIRPLIDTVMSRDAILFPLAATALVALLERQNLWTEITTLGGLDILFLLAGCGNAQIEQCAAELIVHLAKNRDARVQEFLGRPRLSQLLTSGSPRIQNTLLAIFSTVPKEAPVWREVVADPACLKVLVFGLSHTDIATRQTIADIFAELSDQNGAPAKLREARLVAPLLDALFKDSTPELRRSLVQCACRLSLDAAAAEEMSNSGALLALVGLFDAAHPDHDTLLAIEALLRYPQARAGVLSDPAFTRALISSSLSNGSLAVQEVALRMLALLSSDPQFASNAEKAGLLAALLPFVTKGDKRALSALLALVLSYPAARGALTRAGLLPPLVQQLNNQTDEDAREIAVEVISSAAFDDGNRLLLLDMLLPMFPPLLESQRTKIKFAALCSLSSLAVSSANREKLRGSAVLSILVSTLVAEHAAVLLPALEATDSLCLDGKILDAMVQQGVMGRLLSLLSNPHSGIVVGSIRVLRNITRNSLAAEQASGRAAGAVAALLTSTNDAVLIPALDILIHLALIDDIRKSVRESPQVLEFLKGAGAHSSQLLKDAASRLQNMIA